MNILSDSRHIVIIAVAVLYFKSSLNPHARMIVNLPGVFLHESMHYIAVLIFNGKPTNFSLFPKQQQDGSWIGGFVNFSNLRWYNAMPIGLAPLLILLLAWNLHRGFYGVKWWSSDFLIVQDILYVVLEACLIEASLPSITDIKIILSKPTGILFYAVSCLLLCNFLVLLL
jgi:hypothetical protein